jgi:hypothetical protein
MSLLRSAKGRSRTSSSSKGFRLPQPEVGQLLGFRDHGYDAENPESARLLLRVPSDAQADSTWGDEDFLDIYVPAADLKKGVFRRAYPYCGD